MWASNFMANFVPIGDAAAVLLVDMGIPLRHSQSFIMATPAFGGSSCIPVTIIPLNGASIPVAFLSKTDITIPFPWGFIGSYLTI